MTPDQKVLIPTLWQRTSERGNEYLSGFLGKARVIGFRGETRPDGTETWDLFVCPQEEAVGSGQREPRSPTSSTRSGVQRWAGKAPKSPVEFVPDRPFFDDPIDDLGRGK